MGQRQKISANTEIYAQALKEATEEYGHEDPEFYSAMQKSFDENDNI